MEDQKPIAIIAGILIVIIGGGIWWFSRSASSSNTSPKAVIATEAPIDGGKGITPPPVVLPPLGQMDAFLRPMLEALSNRPELAKWLATDDLIRQMAMAIDQASTGDSPARDLKILKPAGSMSATRRGTRSTIDPASYKRYDGLVQTLTSMDATKVAGVYKTIRPRLNEAYQQSGNPGGNVESALLKTIDILLDTPTVKDPIEVIGSGAQWSFTNDDLESLMPTQKQLLRMGPENVEKLQAWLKTFRDSI